MPSETGSRLYIAGSSSAVPRPGCANSGYLVRSARACIAADFGSGAFSKLLHVTDVFQLHAIVISHMHADHFFDLVPLRYGLKYEMLRETRLPVYLPTAGIKALTQIAHPLKETDDFFGEVFELHEYGPGDVLKIGDTTITFTPTLHYIPAYAMRMKTPDAVFVFSADTAPSDMVVEHAKDADVFLCECALGPDGVETGAVKGHSSAQDAGKMAAAANVKHLVLTHYGASAEPAALREAAERHFSGQITVANDGLEVPLVQSVVNEHV